MSSKEIYLSSPSIGTEETFIEDTGDHIFIDAIENDSFTQVIDTDLENLQENYTCTSPQFSDEDSFLEYPTPKKADVSICDHSRQRQKSSHSGKRKLVKRKAWKQSDMVKALKAVRQDGISHSRAARTFNVPRRTLSDRINKNVKSDNPRLGREVYLTLKQEKDLCQYIDYLKDRGFDLTINQVLRFASYIDKNRGFNKFGPNGPSVFWWDKFFKKRNPDHSSLLQPYTPPRMSRLISAVDMLRYYFNLIKNKIEGGVFHNIYYCDEIIIQLIKDSKKLIVPKRLIKKLVRQTEEKQQLAIQCCVNALGGSIPPYIILKENYSETNTSNKNLEGISYAYNKNGFMDSGLFLNWFKTVFIQNSCPTAENPVVLLLNGNFQNWSVEVLDLARKHNVELLAFPPLVPHPLDVAAYNSLENSLNNMINFNQSFIDYSSLTNIETVKMVLGPYEKSMSTINIQEGFKKCGIHPFNPNAIDKRKLLRKNLIPDINVDLSIPPENNAGVFKHKNDSSSKQHQENQEEFSDSFVQIDITILDSSGSKYEDIDLNSPRNSETDMNLNFPSDISDVDELLPLPDNVDLNMMSNDELHHNDWDDVESSSIKESWMNMTSKYQPRKAKASDESKKKKSSRKNMKLRPWSQEDMKEALIAVREHGHKIAYAAKMFNVPRTTLSDRVNNKVPSENPQYGRATFLTSEQEQELCRCIEFMTAKGFYLSVNHILMFAQYLDSVKGSCKFGPDGPSEWWWYYFKKRHPEHARLRHSLTLERGRLLFSTVDVFRYYFNLLKVELENGNFDDNPHRIYYCDETIVDLTDFSRKIVIPKREKNAKIKQSKLEKYISIEWCVNAVGHALPPYVIFKDRLPEGNYSNEGPENAIYVHQKTGSMDSKSFVYWFKNLFLPHTRPTLKSPVMLLLDRSIPHCSIELIDLAHKHNVVLLGLAPFIEQPLDVVVYPCFEASLSRLFSSGELSSNDLYFIKSIIRIIKLPYDKCTSSENIKEGFWNCGIHPFDPHIIDKHYLLRKKFIPDIDTDLSLPAEDAPIYKHRSYDYISPSSFLNEELPSLDNNESDMDEKFTSLDSKNDLHEYLNCKLLSEVHGIESIENEYKTDLHNSSYVRTEPDRSGLFS